MFNCMKNGNIDCMRTAEGTCFKLNVNKSVLVKIEMAFDLLN